MKIAFFSDVHANLPALEAAIDAADRYGAERLVVAGDHVGDGPFPLETLKRLREAGAVAIRGNVDNAVLRLGTKRKRLEKRLSRKSGKKQNRAWTALQLRGAEAERGWLAELPAQRWLEAEGRRVLVVHGSPLGETDYIYPSLTTAGLTSKLAPLRGERPDILVCGHSHVGFAREVAGTLVINCGSVGRPADGDPRGSLAMVDLSRPQRVGFGILRFRYPVEAVARALAEREVPGVEGEEYRLGVKR